MELKIEFGALQPTFAKQLEAQGLNYDEKVMDYLQELRESITYLYFVDLINDSSREKAMKKLFKMIESNVKKKNKLIFSKSVDKVDGDGC
jgi:Na+/phosphate symporter